MIVAMTTYICIQTNLLTIKREQPDGILLLSDCLSGSPLIEKAYVIGHARHMNFGVFKNFCWLMDFGPKKTQIGP